MTSPIFEAPNQPGPDWVIIIISVSIGVGTLLCTLLVYLWTAGWRRRRKAGQILGQRQQQQQQGLGNARASVLREEFKVVSEDGRLHKVSKDAERWRKREGQRDRKS